MQRWHTATAAPSRPNWGAQGAAAIAAGDLDAAKRSFGAAVRAEVKNPLYRFQLAVVLEGLGEFAAAAEQLTIALRLDPKSIDAARRLSMLLGRGALPDDARLDPAGLMAALRHDRVDRDLLSAAVLHHLSRSGPLRRALDQMQSREPLEVARGLCLKRTGDVLKDRLLLEALGVGTVVSLEMERLLTAVRRVLLLEVPGTRFSDPALVEFIGALMRQCWLNEFVWAETPEEIQALEDVLKPERLDSAGPDGARGLLVRFLYRPPIAMSSAGFDLLEPRALRELVGWRIEEQAELRNRAATLERLGAVTDPTSCKVAAQYESSPYPRWTSTPLLRNGQFLSHLETYFSSRQLAFAKRPFEVLVAGCGTGKQAVSAAFDYGPEARVLGLDISTMSLAYASKMAERFGAGNVRFAQGDLRDVARYMPSLLGKFQVVECCGVLHHMDDLFGAWRELVRCLAPGGIMLVGLYSRLARSNLELLRGYDVYPGAGCDNAALRRFRGQLMAAPADYPGSEFMRSRDFFSSSGFRDLYLHVSERSTTLPEISDFLAENGLAFRGFVDVPFEALKQRFPGETLPGSLGAWDALEQEHPAMFGRMYQFWCVREASAVTSV